MEKNKRIIGFIGAVIFSFGFVAILNWINDNKLFGTGTFVLGTAILIIVLLVSSLFNWHGKEEIIVSRERVSAFKIWMDR